MHCRSCSTFIMRRASLIKFLTCLVVGFVIYLFLFTNSSARRYSNVTLLELQQLIELKDNQTVKDDSKIIVSFVVCNRRLDESLNVVKSAIIFTNSPLYFIIFTDNKLQPLINKTLTNWKQLTNHNFQFELQQINFPKPHQADWMNLFSKCAAQRLFFPNLLQHINSLIYVDIDTLFLGPVDELWNQFNKFKNTEIVGLVLENNNPIISWYPRFAQHPFYGKTGVNSGVMLMDLKKMRIFSWVDYVTPIMLKWKLKIPWGDQDIINIILHYHPEAVHEMSCRYNYRPDMCMYGDGCAEATADGVHLLHGSRAAFQNDKQPIFKAIYKAINEYDLQTGDIRTLISNMNKYLNETPKSVCGELKNSFVLVPNRTVNGLH